MENVNADEGKMRRFSYYRIIEHWFHVAGFFVLVTTGLVQKYHYLEISQWLILKTGGIDITRIIHRFAGLLFFIFIMAHIIIAVGGIILRKWEFSLMITKRDFQDVVENIKYYVGMKKRPAKCGRYNYKQKFEYWGILLGIIVMGISGCALWFPAFATQYFPGQIIPAAKVLHSSEALVIVLIVAIWHMYNAIFSPEVFPLDTSIFTGYISEERMSREHPLEFEHRNVQKRSRKKFDVHEQLEQVNPKLPT
jgi:formate dehydrogenase gamma subunit